MLGGILVESVVSSRVDELPEQTGEPGKEGEKKAWKWAVVGIGININQTEFPSSLPNPVSLKQITGKTFEVGELARELGTETGRYWDRLLEHPQEILEEYNEHLYRKNRLVKLRKDNRVFEATLKKVTADGRLHVQHALEEDFAFGEVEWIL
jgi:BirA family biotin operon repressor/biotin-[acetyl-CoA-carboxylase] ligase